MGYTEESEFLRLGEHPILDFCNTFVLHGQAVEDRLQTRQSTHNFFCEFFNENLKVDDKKQSAILEIRKNLRLFFQELMSAEKTESSAKKRFTVFDKYPMQLKITASSEIIFKSIDSDCSFVEPLINSFHNFMSNFQIDRLKKCKNPNCSHLFYDRSKNNTRSWCSMKSCGNIMKARAFYQRSKK